MNKHLLLSAATLLISLGSFAQQLGIYQFSHTNGNSCSSPILTVTSQPANATFSAFSRNNVSCQSQANVMNSKNWPTSDNINTSYYVQFSITANPGYSLTLTSIKITCARNDHGPHDARIAHNNSGNFTTNYYDFETEDHPETETWNFSDFTTSAGGTVTFRIYGWEAENPSSTFYVDNVKLFGTVVAPAPTANAGSNINVCTGTSAITMTGATAGGSYGSVAWSGGTGLGSWSGSGTNPATYQFTPSVNTGSFTATLTVYGSGSYTGTNPTSTRTISWGVAGLWYGTVDNSWFTAGNWCAIPDANTDVTIPVTATYQPNVNADGAICRNININAGSSLTINASGKIHIKGNYINSGSPAMGIGCVSFDGTSAQTLTGNDNFGSMEVNNASGVSIISGTQNITGVVTLTSGNVTTNGNAFVLKSDAAATAQISGTGTGSITGNITVERYIPNSSNGNYTSASHYLSSPVTNATLSQFSDDFNMILNNWNYNPPSYGTFYYYDETHLSPYYSPVFVNEFTETPFPYDRWKAPVGITVMQGYSAWVDNTITIDVTGNYNHAAAPSIPLTYTAAPGGMGFNLVGNPYPSQLDWNAASGWTKTNITNTVYIWNPQFQQYATWNGVAGTNGGTRYIAGMQGFFVVATGPGAQLGVSNAARVTSAADFFKTEEASQLVKLALTGNGQRDETVVYFNSEAADDLDISDAYKVKSNVAGVPMLASRCGNQNLSINALSGFNTEMIVPLAFESTAGTYTITASVLEGFEGFTQVYLEDAVLGNSQALTESAEYTFSTTGNDEYRFSLRFSSDMVTNVNSAGGQNAKFYTSNGQVVIEANGIESTANLSMYNAAGQVIIPANAVNFNAGRYSFDVASLSSGIYFVELTAGGERFNGKVVVR